MEKGNAEISDSLFMTVGNKPITKSDVVDEIKTILILNNESYSEDKMDRLHKIAVKSIIKRSIRQIEIEKNNFLEINQEDLEKELIKFKNQTIIISFKDKIQNYGIIGALVFSAKTKDKALEIGNWVMSCRVFSRRIENYIIDHLIKKAKKAKYNKINFKFDKTEKNIYLQDFLKRLKIKIEKNKKYYSNNKF